MTTPVTLVTRDATLDDLSLSDYRDMLTEVREKMSLDKMLIELGSEFSKAQWWKVEKGETQPNRKMRNELRRYFDRPLLPPTVAEATAAVSHDAAVWQVGDGPAEHVIMVTTVAPMTLHVNGAVTVAGDGAQNARYGTQEAPGTTKRVRRHVDRPTPSETQVERFSRLSTTWRAVIDKGLAAMEWEAGNEE
jgi:hypothetical protein